MRKVKLVELCEIVNGSTLDTSNLKLWGEDISWITPKDIGNKYYIFDSERKISNAGLKSCSTSIIPINSVLMTSRAPVGNIAINKISLCTNQGHKALIPNDKIYYKYLFYFLLFYKPNLDNLSHGNTFKEITKGAVENIEVTLTETYEEQIAIAEKLDKQMAEIETMRQAAIQQKDAAEAMEASILREVFPYQNDEELSKVCRINNISNYPSKSEKCLLFSIEAYDNCKKPEETFVKDLGSEKNVCEFGNILFCKMNPRKNRVWNISVKSKLPMLCSSEFVPLIPFGVDPDYLTLFLSSDYFTNQLKQYVKGATKSRSRVNPKDLMKIKISLPNNKEDQKKIALVLQEKIEEIRKFKEKINNSLDAIDALPSSILRETFKEV